MGVEELVEEFKLFCSRSGGRLEVIHDERFNADRYICRLPAEKGIEGGLLVSVSYFSVESNVYSTIRIEYEDEMGRKGWMELHPDEIKDLERLTIQIPEEIKVEGRQTLDVKHPSTRTDIHADAREIHLSVNHEFKTADISIY